ncbi:FAD-dependent oxidoreductase [Nitratireductor mangrovi]|uniref:FAD-dependent oxidoreductase n=1 Tax=Nitratireductor mangrovi TaxID=2599600 RepID=A0A5B8L153_9HYPH|nr:FAD-dependent oxidoreductase [Nitratireductor mangrovi]QDZ01553.1 FAD-dependent oxidoreductase [Nitratireductor mangrovi]
MTDGKSTFSRRSMLTGLSAGAGLAGLSAISSAKAANLPTPEIVESFDVVVIGTGLAGTAAALEAASSGARVAVLDKASENRAGGNSALSAGIIAMPASASSADSAAYLEDFVSKGQGRGNRAIYELMAQNTRADVEWLRTNGAEFTAQGTMPPYRIATVTTAPGPYMGMPRTLAGLRNRIEELGGHFFFDTKAKHLVLNENGAVAGVRAIGSDGVIELAGQSVVVTTGGYAANPQIIAAYSDPNAEALMVRGIDWATGDGLRMAGDVGAGLRGMGGIMALHIAAVDAVETAAGNPFAALPYCISVNQEGKRFVDESRGYVAHGKAVLGQPGQRASLVFDQTIAELPATQTTMATFRRLGIDIIEASTLDELAKELGVPSDTLAATIADFNVAVSGGAAPEASPPKAALARKIERAPFYAFHPLAPGVTLTFGGLMINDNAEVLEADGRVIAGLYAAGEGAGHVFYDDYVGGGSLANCLVMGRIAGREAALAG